LSPDELPELEAGKPWESPTHARRALLTERAAEERRIAALVSRIRELEDENARLRGER